MGLVLLAGLSACDYGPTVEGGMPQVVYEPDDRGGRSGPLPYWTHYYEVTPTNLEHPLELKAFFRWRCRELHRAYPCTILAWLPGAAPHHRLGPFPSEKDSEAATYRLVMAKDSGELVIAPYKSNRQVY